jgi:hypothetical protein
VDVELTLPTASAPPRQLDIAPGFPGNDLSDAQQLARFADCMAYAPWPLPPAQVQALLDAVDGLATLPDARALTDLLVA